MTIHVIFNGENYTVKQLNFTIILICIGFTGVVVFVNSWSIRKIKKYIEKKEAESEDAEPICKYCNAANPGFLLCNSCKSIMWNSINSSSVQIATFIAQHRWSVITSSFAFLVIAPLSLVLGMKNEKIKEIDSVIERVEKFIESQNDLRSLLQEYSCDMGLGINKIKDIYKDVSWEIPILIQEIDNLTGEKLKRKSLPCKKCSGLEYAKFVRSIILDGDSLIVNPELNKSESTHKYFGKSRIRIEIKEKKLFIPKIHLKERWGDFIISAYTPNNSSDCKQKAFNLYCELKVQNVVLREFSLHLRGIDIESSANFETLNNFFGNNKDEFNLDSLITVAISNYRISKVDSLTFGFK